jgi:hypothetical protein
MKHRASRHCGKVAALNVRCVEGLDFEALPLQHHDCRAV